MIFPVPHRVPPIGPLLSYYGSKWRVAPKYPPPKYDTIVEPFAGSAGYSCNYWDRQVILVEKNPVVAGVLRYLIQSDPEDILKLPLLRGSARTLDDLDWPCQEARWLAGFWVNNAVVQPCSKPSPWSRAYPNRPPFWSTPILKRLAQAASKIKHWKVIEGDYDDAPDTEATWFVDPPYQVAGIHYPTGQPDYDALRQWCLSRRGQVIVCEADGATWMDWNRALYVTGAPRPHLKGRGSTSDQSIVKKEVFFYAETGPGSDSPTT